MKPGTPAKKAKPSLTAVRILRFRVTLRDITPAIWRVLELCANATFWDLHCAIQNSFGWTHSHLHQFSMLRAAKTRKIVIGIPDDEWVGVPGMPKVLAGWTEPVRDWLTEPGHAALYEYDFGDSWEHDVVLEAIALADPGAKLPRCVAGENKGPPDDVGGPHGYSLFLEAMSDPRHEEHASYREWIGGKWNPREFEAGKVKFVSAKRWLADLLAGG